jgi:hypothetical protein
VLTSSSIWYKIALYTTSIFSWERSANLSHLFACIFKHNTRLLTTDIGDSLLSILLEMVKIKGLTFNDEAAFKGVTWFQASVL